MLSEYAVEPQAIGSSWETFRYVIEKFGFDRGRLISQFPKHWFRDVYDATAGLPPMQKKRVEEALSQARKNKVVRSQRPYDGEAGNWLHNAVTEQQRSPFRAIIASQNPNGEDFILLPGDLDETHPLLAVEHDCPVARDAHSIAAAMKEFLQFGSRIVFVDAFYSPYRAEYKSTFRRNESDDLLLAPKTRRRGFPCAVSAHREGRHQDRCGFLCRWRTGNDGRAADGLCAFAAAAGSLHPRSAGL